MNEKEFILYLQQHTIDQLLEIDLSLLDESYINWFEKYVSERADTECYQIGIDYNIKDTALIERMEDKLKYIELAATIAYKAGSNFSDTFGTVAVWDNITYKYLHQKNIIVYNRDAKDRPELVGAFVKPPIVGKHKWVVSFDLNSLYPNLIIQYNMSPETIINKVESNYNTEDLLDKKILNNSDDVIAANGVHFSKNKKGFIPTLVQDLYDERVKIKKEMISLKKSKDKKHDLKISQLESQQMAIKILMNSLYGAMGNIGFRYFDYRIASAITLGGQLAIKWAEKTINQYFNKVLKTDKDYVIAIDTDSLYICLDDLVSKNIPKDTPTTKIVDIIDQLCKSKIEPLIKSSYQDLHDYMKSYENRMEMKRENIADVGIWTGKKHYILNVYDSEGVRYDEPKLKIMGIEAVKSSTPAVCRNSLKESFNIIINGNEEDVQKFIKQKRVEFEQCNVEDVAFPRSVNDLLKYTDKREIYGKKTPINVRGALLYNHFVSQLKLDKTLEKIQNGDKIKFIYLKVPNPIKEDVIAFPSFLPDQFNLKPYIDYDLQFEKAFLKPLRSVLDAIGWKEKKQSSIMTFFE